MNGTTNHAGNAFRKYRNTNNILQEELAERLGINQGTVSNIERGARNVSAAFAEEIENKINIPKEDLRPDLFTDPAWRS